MIGVIVGRRCAWHTSTRSAKIALSTGIGSGGRGGERWFAEISRPASISSRCPPTCLPAPTSNNRDFAAMHESGSGPTRTSGYGRFRAADKGIAHVKTRIDAQRPDL